MPRSTMSAEDDRSPQSKIRVSYDVPPPTQRLCQVVLLDSIHRGVVNPTTYERGEPLNCNKSIRFLRDTDS
jgi:hypothetical protein